MTFMPDPMVVRGRTSSGRSLQDCACERAMEAAGIEPAFGRVPHRSTERKYCYAQCRDPFFNECADCWQSGGNPPSQVKQGGNALRPAKPATTKGAWDQYYLEWLEDPEKTISTPLRLEIASRLRELLNG